MILTLDRQTVFGVISRESRRRSCSHQSKFLKVLLFQLSFNTFISLCDKSCITLSSIVFLPHRMTLEEITQLVTLFCQYPSLVV